MQSKGARQMSNVSLILASASPRRRALLSLLGLPFRVVEAHVEERRLEGESPQDMVMRLSRRKAKAVAAGAQAEGIVVACDTIVVLNGGILSKPRDPQEAASMLRRLRGRKHTVYSGLTVLQMERAQLQVICDETEVYMRSYGDEEVAAYVATGDPLDKAGAYAIQSAGFRPVARVQGCHASVMGLPLRLVAQTLRALGLPVPADDAVAESCAAFTGHPCCIAAVTSATG